MRFVVSWDEIVASKVRHERGRRLARARRRTSERNGFAAAARASSRLYISRRNLSVYFLQNREMKRKATKTRKRRKKNRRKRERARRTVAWLAGAFVSLGPLRIAGTRDSRARDRANTRRLARRARVTMSKGSKRSDRCLSRLYRQGDDMHSTHATETERGRGEGR